MNDETVSEVSESESFIPVRKESGGDVSSKLAKKKKTKKLKLLAPKKSVKVSAPSVGRKASPRKTKVRSASASSRSQKTIPRKVLSAGKGKSRSVGVAPTRKGKEFYSGWKSRTHLRTAMAKDSALQCQRNSRTKIWKRDMVSVGPGKEKQVTCGRCRMVIDNSTN